MNAPVTIVAPHSINELREFFVGICEKRADLYADGFLTLQEVVDELQAIADLTGLVPAIGQDAVQELIAGPQLVPDLGEACEAEIELRAAALVREWELADPRDRWRHTGEPKPVTRREPPARIRHATPQSVVDAFLSLAAQGDTRRLEAWLDEHRNDAPALLKLLEAQ